MSGSIGASRIRTRDVKNTVSDYITRVLTAMPGFVSTCPTGSYIKYYNTHTEKLSGHGDIDLVVHITPKEGESLPELKKRFMRLCEILDDSVTVPFMSGNNKEKKVQMYGDVVTVQFPITQECGSKEVKYVQIDNMIATSEKESYFMQQFLSMPAIEQSLLMASLRTVPQDNIISFFNEIGLKEYLPQNIGYNQRLEIILSPRHWSLVLVTLDSDNKEIKKERQALYTNDSWQILKFMNHYFFIYNLAYITDFSRDYKYMAEYIYNKYKDNNDKEHIFSRIVGILKSIVSVKTGEVGTMKETEKLDGIGYIEKYLV